MEVITYLIGLAIGLFGGWAIWGTKPRVQNVQHVTIQGVDEARVKEIVTDEIRRTLERAW